MKFSLRSFSISLVTALACLLPIAPNAYALDELKIPNLGASSTSLFSQAAERRLGNLWLKVFRAQAPVLDDPLLYDYIENLIFDLVIHSQLFDRGTQLVIVDNPTINAFAVPGGIIGVHNGLLHHAQTEDELACLSA